MQIKIEEISENRVQGYRLMPESVTSKGTIITFGGSEGSSWLEKAVDIAEKGYAVLSLYYFGKENLPNKLSYIDLSFFDDVLHYIEQDDTLDYPLILVGISRGAELAAMLARENKVVSTIILYSPSAYVFSGFDDNPSWLVQGENFPYITFSKKTRRKRFWNKRLALVESFTYELANNNQVQDYLIDLAAFKGNLLLFSGKQDQVWPSEQMADVIKNTAINAQTSKHVTFDEAGHTFNRNYYDGGTLDGNLYAYYKSQEILWKKLNQWHGI